MQKEKQKEKASRRRHEKFRMRHKAIKISKACMPHWELIWQSADHLAKCSCWMCGNPRKYSKGQEKLSQQEKRFLDIMQQDLRELE